MTEHLWPMLMLLALMAGVFSGYPVAFILAGVGILFAVVADVPMLFLSMGVQRIYSGILTNWLLVAIPLFVFMGLMLERSGIAERLMRSLAALFRGLPGGYAFAVAIIGVIMAASTGIIGASSRRSASGDVKSRGSLKPSDVATPSAATWASCSTSSKGNTPAAAPAGETKPWPSAPVGG